MPIKFPQTPANIDFVNPYRACACGTRLTDIAPLPLSAARRENLQTKLQPQNPTFAP